MSLIVQDISTNVIQRVTAQQANHYKIVPYQMEGNLLSLYAKNTDNFNELKLLFGHNIHLEIVEEDALVKLLIHYYRIDATKEKSKQVKEYGNSEDFLKEWIVEASELRSSDIHIEALENKCRIRFRIDGKLIERYILKKDKYPELVNKIKILSSLDISEKRLPQDGRISFDYNQHKFDLRVSVLPTMYGEKIVLRILGADAKDIKIEKIGFSEEELITFKKGIEQSNGIVLVSGPTGSGKTTTLYATLNYLNNKDRNIITIEDPIEYTLEGINQVQLKESIGLDFPKALRSFLRQDPDIIMVGEIRDKATAEMAVRASLTGHLVLSTIHTNSAEGTIARLIDMGIPPFLVADTLNLSVAQRLIRLLCKNCKTTHQLEKHDLPENFQKYAHKEVYQKQGCPKCFYTGYKDRIAVFETILIDNQKKSAIKEKKGLPISSSFNTLADSCMKLLIEGKTSLEEVYPILLTN